ncbi:hypothetical protein BU17DRAFT_42073 [Hysterangium stoloniferum]|nr:hypothetical protein BU17DRAFT_42073 [Hysterangium stoloniferum]
MTENQPHEPSKPVRATGGFTPVLLFVLTLAAFVVQSSLTQYVQGELGFRQPFFLLYCAHTSFIILFPIHILYLKLISGKPFDTYVEILRQALKTRLSTKAGPVDKTKDPIVRFVVLILALTAGINIPGLLWYAAISLASISDVTALWNTNSFWVYVLTVWLYGKKWHMRKLGAVLLATVGVTIVVYGGATSSDGDGTSGPYHEGPRFPVLGDSLTLIASIFYAIYQVMYKRYAALPNPSDPEAEDEPPPTLPSYHPLSDDATESSTFLDGSDQSFQNIPQGAPPFGFYPNFITSCLGLCSGLTLAAGFPILHWLSLERFRLPSDSRSALCVVGIATSGLTFNACFMILLGLWGPILVSVGSLLTIVLVLVTDFLFNHGSITLWSLLGSGMIVSAFAALAFDMLHAK